MMSSTLVILCSLVAAITAQGSNPGDPYSLANYPPCAVQCRVEVQRLSSNPCPSTASDNLTCICDVPNRAANAACKKISCSQSEIDTTDTLAQELCGPLYANNTINPTAVSSAIASATAAAAAAVAGKNASDTNDYPACASSCQQKYLPASGCGSIANASCACSSPIITGVVGRCQAQTCSPADLKTTQYLAYALCAPVGGIGNASVVANQTVASQTAGAVPSPSSGGVVPFTGGAGGRGLETEGWISLMGLVVVASLVL